MLCPHWFKGLALQSGRLARSCTVTVNSTLVAVIGTLNSTLVAVIGTLNCTLVALQAIPSYKLLDLGFQMCSRLADTQTSFQKLLQSLLLRLSVHHPHHMLLHLLSLEAQPGTGKEEGAKGLLHVRISAYFCLRQDVCSARQPL
jgi:fatty acid desaturase